MQKYARYKMDGPAPWRVLGWLDRDSFNYPDPEPGCRFRKMTAEEWENRGGHWGVDAQGNLVPMEAPPIPVDILKSAVERRLRFCLGPHAPVTFEHEGTTYQISSHDLSILEKTHTQTDSVAIHAWDAVSGKFRTREIDPGTFWIIAQAFYLTYAKRRHQLMLLLERAEEVNTAEELQAIMKEI